MLRARREPGRVLRGLIEAERLRLRAAAGGTPNGVYIHDRRGGERVEVVNVDSRALDRHATDEPYGIALGAGLDADVALVTGCQPADVVSADIYRRLVSDLRANGKVVIADLTGPPLRATLQGGVELIRLSEEELVWDKCAASDSTANIVAGAQRLHAAGAPRARLPRVGARPADRRRPERPGRACSPGVRVARPARRRRLDVRRDRRRARAGDEHDRCASPRDGRRRAERHAPRSRHRHTRRDRAARRPRDGQSAAGATDLGSVATTHHGNGLDPIADTPR